MTLQNELYTLSQMQRPSDTEAIAEITLLPESLIYKAHFPGHPITPGACIVQMIKEQAQQWLGYPIEVTKVVNLKFLMVIDPSVTPQLQIRMKVKNADESSIHLLSELADGETVFSKTSILFAR